MSKRFNREKLKQFILRRKSNTLGLIILTALSALITLIASLTGFARAHLLAIVTLLLVGLCLVQLIRVRSSFRTLKSKGLRRKKRQKKS